MKFTDTLHMSILVDYRSSICELTTLVGLIHTSFL